MIWLLATVALAGVGGRVQVEGSGDPITPATLTFTPEAGDPFVLATDAQGRFTADLPDGVYTVHVEALDYEPVDAEVTLPLDHLRFRLRYDPPLVVVVEAFDQSPNITRHQVDAEMALETPGTYEDSVRLVQSLPGVAVQREYSPTAGDLSVRGSGNGDNRYYLDGIELPYLYHYNQYASVFPTSQIKSLDLYPSTQGAPYGDATGAIIEVTSHSEQPARVHGGASLNFVMAGADVQIPLKNGWWLAAAGRRSYQDLFGEQTSQFTLWPIFHDYAVRAGRDTEGGGTQFFLWGAGDRYDRAVAELDTLDPVEAAETPQFAYRRAFEVLGASHRWKNDRSRIVGAVVYDRLKGDIDGGGSEDLRSAYLASRYDDQWFVREGLRLYAGVEVRGERTSLVVDPSDLGVLVAEEAPALARGEAVDQTLYRLRTGIYGQARVALGDFAVLPGLRLASDTAGAALLAEPRLLTRWRVAEQTELKLGGGLYHQAPESEHLMDKTGDPTLPTTSSWQVAGGVEQTFAERLELTVEGYNKWLFDPLFYPIDAPAQATDRGRAWGFEITTRYRLREVFFVRAWFGYGRSQVQVPGRGWVPSEGDALYSAGAVASWDLSAHWNLGVRYRIGAGLPYTPVAEGLYDATTDQWLPSPAATNSERMPLFQKVDAHIAYTFLFPTWRMTLYLDLWFVPPSAAQLYPTYNYDYSEQGWVTGPILLPVAGLNARF